MIAAAFGVAVTDDTRRLHERLYREAIRLSGQTMDQAAREAGIDLAQFTRQLAGVEGSLKRLHGQPPAFFQWYAVVLASTFGMPREAQRAARLMFAVLGRKRMARGLLTSRATRRIS